MKFIIVKLIGVPVLIIFIDLGFLLFARDAFTQLITLVPIILLNVFIVLDIIIRPVSAKKDEYHRSILIVTFLSMPIILIFPYFEYEVLTRHFLSPLIYNLIAVSGTFILVLGGVLLLMSRIQLGKYGGPRIVIENNHQLITKGIYQFIRHPMYLGFFLVFFGYSITFGSIIITIIISIVLFLIFNNRIDLEEKLLTSMFGDDYLNYKKRTKRLFPFLY